MRKCVSARDIGLVLRERRLQLGYTQQDMSSYTGFSRRLIGDIEGGKQGVALGKILELCNGLGVDVLLVPRSDDGI